MAAKNQKKPTPNNFLEALRDLGQGVVSEAKTQVKQVITNDIPESFGLPSQGTLKPHESFSPEMAKNQNSEAAFAQRLQQMQEEQQALYRRKESELKQQIVSIQEEIRKLASTMGEFAQEVQVATNQAVVNPGVYHKNFFTHLHSVMRAMRLRVTESKNWLAQHNQRGKKQSYYWGQVKKSGTSYMLSSERYMVTSTG